MQVKTLIVQDRVNHFVNNCGATREEAMLLVMIALERDLATSKLELAAEKQNLSDVAAAIDASIRESFFEIKDLCISNTAYSSC